MEGGGRGGGAKTEGEREDGLKGGDGVKEERQRGWKKRANRREGGTSGREWRKRGRQREVEEEKRKVEEGKEEGKKRRSVEASLRTQRRDHHNSRLMELSVHRTQ